MLFTLTPVIPLENCWFREINFECAGIGRYTKKTN